MSVEALSEYFSPQSKGWDPHEELGVAARETFVPQSYNWGVEAQVDWYEAAVEFEEGRQTTHFCKSLSLVWISFEKLSPLLAARHPKLPACLHLLGVFTCTVELRRSRAAITTHFAPRFFRVLPEFPHKLLQPCVRNAKLSSPVTAGRPTPIAAGEPQVHVPADHSRLFLGTPRTGWMPPWA
jgi:hypothetical protein